MNAARHEALCQNVTVMLERYRWNVSATARHLGIDRCNLKRLMRRYGIQRPVEAR